VLGGAGTLCNPTDPAIQIQQTLKAAGQSIGADDYEAFCETCRMYVSTSSKHCGQCNQCTSGLDHHCKWLNNCVGQANYKVFIALITSLTINVSIVTAYSLLVIYRFYSGQAEVKDNINQRLGGDADGWGAVLCMVVVLCLAINGATLNLIGLHIYLKIRGITTFELVREKRSKKAAAISPESPPSSPVKEQVQVIV
jgi:palmitoyltransferase